MRPDGKQRLLDAAFRLFAEKGFDAVGIREIGKEAGLTNPALYQHFSGKHDLGLAVYRECYQRSMDELDRRIKPGMSVMEKVDAYIDSALSLHKKDPSPLVILEQLQGTFGLAVREEFGDSGATVRFERWMKEGQNTGEIRKDVPPHMLTCLVFGQITFWVVLTGFDLAPKRNPAKWIKTLTRSALA